VRKGENNNNNNNNNNKIDPKEASWGGQPTRLVWTVEVCCGGLLLARQWGFGFR